MDWIQATPVLVFFLLAIVSFWVIWKKAYKH